MKTSMTFLMCFGALAMIGCAEKSETSSQTKPSVDGTKFVMAEEPEGAQEAIAARESAADGEEMTVVGRIGGAVNPWVEDRAAFTIVDNSLKACSDIPGDACKTPWDYCCATDKLPGATVLVKFVDDEGNLVDADARKLLPVEELSTVVGKGKAQRDDEGNLTLLASKVHVKKK